MGDIPAFPRKGLKRKLRPDNEVQVYNLHTPAKRTTVNSDVQFKPIECLTENSISEGMLLLGCITNITDVALKFALPGCLTGIVPLDNISVAYSSLLEQSTMNDDSSPLAALSSLHSMFHIAETYPCKVVSVTKQQGTTKTKVVLSLKPNDVNDDLRSPSLLCNMVISAAVQHAEDHGYIMDIGIAGLNGFIYYSDIQSSSGQSDDLSIGQVIPVCVKAFEPNAKIIPLVPHPKTHPYPKIRDTLDIPLNSFVPGTIVNATVRHACKQGLILHCMGYEACIWREHVPPSIDPEKIVSSELTATVLYIHPLTRLLYLTMNPKPSLERFEFLKSQSLWDKWNVIEEAVVSSVEKRCIYLNLGYNIRGQALKRELSDTPITNFSENYAVNTIHKCRILSVHPMDNIIRVSLKESILNMNIIRPEELIVGAMFVGKMHKFVRNGMILKLSPNVHGFVRDIQMVDGPCQNPREAFEIGMDVQCRILSVDFTSSPHSVFLTCKNSLCDLDLPLLTSYVAAYPGFITKGVVVHVAENYILLLFFNEVQGLVTKSQTGGGIYYVGQVVKCKVTFCNPEDKVLHMSIKNVSKVESLDACLASANFCTGQVIGVCITQKKKRGFVVQFMNSSITGFLPYEHLTDYVEHVNELSALYSVNDSLSVLIFSTKKNLIVSAKYLMLQAAYKNELSHQPSEFESGKLVPGVIKDFNSGGMVLELGNNVTGYVPKRLMKDNEVTEREGSFMTEQTLLAKIMRVGTDLQIKLSTRLSDVFNKNPSYSLDALESYLVDKDKLKTLHGRSFGNVKKMARLTVGDVVSVEIIKIDAVQVQCRLKNGVDGFASVINSGEGLETGKSYKAVILNTDFSSESVEVSLDCHLVKFSMQRKSRRCTDVEVGQVVKAKVILIAKEFVLVRLEEHALGMLAYLPARKVINDELGRTRLYSIDQYYHVVIERIWEGRVLAVLEKHKQLYERHISKVQQSSLSLLCNEDSSQSMNLETAFPCCQGPETTESHGIPIEDSDSSNNPIPSIQDLNIECTVGDICSATVLSVKKMQINIIMNKNLRGRVHVTNIGTSKVGAFPLKSYSKGDTFDVKILSYHKKRSFNYLILSHRHFMNYAECALAVNPVSTSSIVINRGEEIIGFVEKVTDYALSVSLSPEQNAELPFLHISHDVKDICEMSKSYKIGESVKSTVLTIPPDFHLTLTHLAINWIPVEGENVAAFIQIASPDRGFVVKLAHFYYGEIAVTDIADDFSTTENIMSKMINQGFILCCVLETDESSKSCVLSTRTSRLYNHSEIVDREITSENIANGQSFRGFIRLVTSSAIHVNIGRGLKGVVDIDALSSEKKNDIREKYKIGDVVKVTVTSIDPEVNLYINGMTT